jgi:hypothetical protein
MVAAREASVARKTPQNAKDGELMNLFTLIRKELLARPGPVITSTLIILLGVTALVTIKNLTTYSELAVARELDALGANILILPKGVSVQNCSCSFYAQGKAA